MDLVLAFKENTSLFLLVISTLGLFVGSFLNVVIYRLPEMLQRGWKQECNAFLELEDSTTVQKEVFNLSLPASHCPVCKKTLSAIENIPVLSYLFLRGRCRHCQTSIPVRYPLVEAFTAALTFIVAWHFGFSLQTPIALLFVWSLISLTMIDFDTQLLPDNITLPLLWLGLFASLFNTFVSPTSAIIGALAGYLSLWSVYWLFKLATGKEGMGYGDFKLLAAIGALLGWKLLPLVIMLSAFVGAIIGIFLIIIMGRDKATPIPFGPYLSAAGFIALIWGEQLNQLYLNTVAL